MSAGTSTTGYRASFIITSHNRREALQATLEALSRQTVPPECYEVLVVDNGGTDGTDTLLENSRYDYAFRWFRFLENVGIAAARNRAIREATGEYLVLLSDDVLTPPDYLEKLLQTHEWLPDGWIGAATEQLPELNATSFGRYLASREAEFATSYRVGAADELWEIEWPSARNLSIPRCHLEQIGLFDEQFRDACEDQDLAYRARLQLGARFYTHSSVLCVHNDQAADLIRYCRAQARGARDTVAFCRKYEDWYQANGQPPIMRVNSPISGEDSAAQIARKAVRAVLGAAPLLTALEWMAALLGRLPGPEKLQWRMFQLVIGLHIRRGWREGLRTAAVSK